MPLPDNFVGAEHLQDVIRQQENKKVQLYFKDLGETWEPEVNTPRGSLRVACTHLDSDSMDITALRMRLLYDILEYGKNDLIQYHGTKEDIAPPVEGHPRVYLYFSQDSSAVPEGQNKLESEFSFRLLNETYQTFNKTKALEIAREVKSNFIVSKAGIRFDRGKLSAYMKDPVNGFTARQRFLVRTKSDAIDLFGRIYKVMDKPFDSSKVIVNEPDKNSSNTEGTHLVYGEQTKIPGYRRIATLQFRYAYAEVGKAKVVFLVDTTYTKPNPLVDP